jgi:hypothetical protein
VSFCRTQKLTAEAWEKPKGGHSYFVRKSRYIFG